MCQVNEAVGCMRETLTEAKTEVKATYFHFTYCMGVILGYVGE
jgi:hypothetical protein